MSEAPSTHLDLSDQTLFKLIKDHFIAEIRKTKLMSKKLSKYIAAFDYFDKALIVLSAQAVEYLSLPFLVLSARL